MGDLVTKAPWAAISGAAASAKQPSHVAVAYLGQKGDELLPLKKDSKLVVDASLTAVRAGITYPGALLKIQKRGARVFSVPLLHAKVFAFDGVGFVGSTNASVRSRDHLREAVVRVSDAATLADIRAYVEELATDELSKADLTWLGKQYLPPSFPLPQISNKGYLRLLIQIMKSDQQGYSGHQVQPPSGAWAKYFKLNLHTPVLPVLRLRNMNTGSVFDRQVVRHALVMTLDIPEAVPGALLEMWEVGKDRFDYRVILPTDPQFKKLDTEVRSTPNPLWHSGRRWIVT